MEIKELKEFIDNLKLDFCYLDAVADDRNTSDDNDLWLRKAITLYNLSIRFVFYFDFTPDKELSKVTLILEETEYDIYDVVMDLPKDPQLIKEKINYIFKNITDLSKSLEKIAI